jgi:hypothetical protein
VAFYIYYRIKIKINDDIEEFRGLSRIRAKKEESSDRTEDEFLAFVGATTRRHGFLCCPTNRQMERHIFHKEWRTTKRTLSREVTRTSEEKRSGHVIHT